jgi:DnaJ-class molecular chaperone
MDDRELEPFDRAECQECNGTGNVRVILGDDEQQDRCQSCAGTGVQLSRDELCDALSQADGSLERAA